MVYQAQFLAVAGRVGGPQGQPESSQALSGGMAWANYHLFSLNGGGDEEVAERRRRRRYMRREGDAVDGGNSMNATEIRTHEMACEDIRSSDAELGATILMSAISLVGAYFCREAIVRILWWYRRRNGLEAGDPAMPFPSWELQVFLTQFQGLAESSGDAISSGCRGYEVAGGIMIFVLITTLLGTFMLCWYGMRNRHAHWIHVSIKEAWQGMKDKIKESEKKRLVGRILGFKEGFGVLISRGEWDQEDHEHRKDIVHTRFIDRWGSAFDSHHGTSWWYGFWNMFRSLAIGIILSGVSHSRANAGCVLTVGTLDTVLLIVFNPDGDWIEWIKNVYRACMNIAVVGSVLAFIDETMDESIFSNIFQLVSIVSMVPMIISALLAPIISVFEKVAGCFGMFGGGGGDMAAAAALGGVAAAGVDAGAILEDVEATREEAGVERRQSQISLVLDDDEKEALARQQELSATGVSVEPIEGAASSMPGNAVVTQSDIVAGPPRVI